MFALAALLLVTPCLYADDESEILAMLADIDTKIAAHDVAGVMAHYSTDFMQGSGNYDAILADLMENVPRVTSFRFTISAIHIQGEFATVAGTVDGSMDDGEIFTWQEPGQGDEGVGLGWLKKEDGVWRVHGNQSRVRWYTVCAANDLTFGNSSLRIAVESLFAIQSATVNGPYIPLAILTPDAYYGGVSGHATPSQRPAPGTAYTIEIAFSDGARQTITDTIGAWIDTAHNAESTGFYRIDVRLKPLPEPPSLFDVDNSNWVDAILQPGAGDIWQYGTSESVVWKHALLQGSAVSIYVLHDPSAGLADTNPDPMSVQPKNWFQFATNVPNNGIYPTDPSMLSGNGNAYKILIVSDEDYRDMSQGLFVLQP